MQCIQDDAGIQVDQESRTQKLLKVPLQKAKEIRIEFEAFNHPNLGVTAF